MKPSSFLLNREKYLTSWSLLCFSLQVVKIKFAFIEELDKKQKNEPDCKFEGFNEQGQKVVSYITVLD